MPPTFPVGFDSTTYSSALLGSSSDSEGSSVGLSRLRRFAIDCLVGTGAAMDDSASLICSTASGPSHSTVSRNKARQLSRWFEKAQNGDIREMNINRRLTIYLKSSPAADGISSLLRSKVPLRVAQQARSHSTPL